MLYAPSSNDIGPQAREMELSHAKRREAGPSWPASHRASGTSAWGTVSNAEARSRQIWMPPCKAGILRPASAGAGCEHVCLTELSSRRASRSDLILRGTMKAHDLPSASRRPLGRKFLGSDPFFPAFNSRARVAVVQRCGARLLPHPSDPKAAEQQRGKLSQNTDATPLPARWMGMMGPRPCEQGAYPGATGPLQR